MNVKEIEGTSAEWVFMCLSVGNFWVLESDTSAFWVNVTSYGIWLCMFSEAEFYGALNWHCAIEKGVK